MTVKKRMSTTTANGLSLRWVPVATAEGRTRMEMRWSAPALLRRQHHAA